MCTSSDSSQVFFHISLESSAAVVVLSLVLLQNTRTIESINTCLTLHRFIRPLHINEEGLFAEWPQKLAFVFIAVIRTYINSILFNFISFSITGNDRATQRVSCELRGESPNLSRVSNNNKTVQVRHDLRFSYGCWGDSRLKLSHCSPRCAFGADRKPKRGSKEKWTSVSGV